MGVRWLHGAAARASHEPADESEPVLQKVLPFNVIAFLKSPMGMMGAFMLFAIVIMPYLKVSHSRSFCGEPVKQLLRPCHTCQSAGHNHASALHATECFSTRAVSANRKNRQTLCPPRQVDPEEMKEMLAERKGEKPAEPERVIAGSTQPRAALAASGAQQRGRNRR